MLTPLTPQSGREPMTRTLRVPIPWHRLDVEAGTWFKYSTARTANKHKNVSHVATLRQERENLRHDFHGDLVLLGTVEAARQGRPAQHPARKILDGENPSHRGRLSQKMGLPAEFPRNRGLFPFLLDHELGVQPS